MNLFKIVQKRTDKSNRNSSPIMDTAALLLFVFLLPYVISCLWGNVGEEIKDISVSGKGEERDFLDSKHEIGLNENWGIRRISLQEYLIRKLELVMEGDEDVEYELEALKAQAILLRTEACKLFLNNEAEGINIYYLNSVEDSLSEEEKVIYEQAVKETDGLYLSYDNKPIKAAYFPVSNGYTREAAQNSESMNYPYLRSVECSQDILSKNYQSQVSVSGDEYVHIMKELMKIEESITFDECTKTEFIRDSSGYVTEVNFNEVSCDGEIFRNAYSLNSSAFEIEWQENEVIFHVKGMGHGFGMSQYGANAMAASGESFEQILKYYFFQAELTKIE